MSSLHDVMSLLRNIYKDNGYRAIFMSRTTLYPINSILYTFQQNRKRNILLLIQDVIWTSIQYHMNVMDVKTTLYECYGRQNNVVCLLEPHLWSWVLTVNENEIYLCCILHIMRFYIEASVNVGYPPY